MKDDITIPPEALEAAAKAICKDAVDIFRRCKTPCIVCKSNARAACLAMLKAWPERRFRYERNGTYPVVVLPFEETTND